MSLLFEIELTNLLNKHSIENQSDTPDFILARYLLNCLDAYNMAIKMRDNWWGFKTWSFLKDKVDLTPTVPNGEADSNE